ncbi:allantoate amidohydrolase [Paenibacillus swuensis]|uniref:Allantoate amidohydrolase n=1 Tax=Paenibacillus swuensis TaxID=1178515 RepID=A0A172TKR8_9BACL|nr:Zn-dependent hydrolase [Paenibacillus swuensis]ANE47659.1 allantoate amidohydrolase [Paenibacillus swuensis]
MNLMSANGLALQLTALLEGLSKRGADAEGGVTRLLYDRAWLEAQHYLAERMKEAGLDIRYDRVGNLYGRLQGSDSDAPVVLTGSHVDTVRSGGYYDGAYGIAAGIAAISHLRETYGTPLRTLEVVSLCEEEGSRFPITYWGSGHIAGKHDINLAPDILDEEGISLHAAMSLAGFGRSEQPDPRRADLAAYVEVHIEQGILLEKLGQRVGLVDTIVGQRRYSVHLSGVTNHAGTTPMLMRLDALAGAAEMLGLLETEAMVEGEPLVATVGKLETAPNTPNVIPGTVKFTVDIRHDQEKSLTDFSERMLTRFGQIAARRGLEIEITSWLSAPPTPMDPSLMNRLQTICNNLSLPSRRMVSGAGHDAQLFAQLCPSAMLFVPSRGGISHSPEEYTPDDELIDGAAVLAELLRQLAYDLPEKE